MAKTDLRITKTRRNIRNSFFQLIQQKDYDDITVKEICDLAECSRNAFYEHFEYKDNLYNIIIDECITSALKGFYALTSSVEEQTDEIIHLYIRNIMEGVNENADELRILLKHDNHGLFRSRFAKAVFNTMVKTSEQASGCSGDFPQWQLVNHFSAGGFIGFIIFWLESAEIDLEEAQKIDLNYSIMGMGAKYLK